MIDKIVGPDTLNNSLTSQPDNKDVTPDHDLSMIKSAKISKNLTPKNEPDLHQIDNNL